MGVQFGSTTGVPKEYGAKRQTLWIRIFGEFRGISQIWEATTANE